MTNGEKIKELFPSFDVEDKTEYFGRVRNLDDHFIKADIEWWNTEYKEPTTKNDPAFCPDRKAKTTHMETILHCIEDECFAYKDGRCLKYNSEQEPTTKNDLGVSSELEKNSKKLEKDFGELDCISRKAVIDELKRYFHDEYYQRTSIQDCRDCFIEDVLNHLPSVTPQEPILDKIRAEIDNILSDGMIHKKTVLGIIDKYKADRR